MSHTYNQYAPQPIQTSYLSASGLQATGSPLSTTNAGTMMVHTPYSCEHDLVPSNSEVASQCFGSSLPKDGDVNNGSFSGSNTQLPHSAMSRRSTNSQLASPQPAQMHTTTPTFDPWTGQVDAEQQHQPHRSTYQRPRGNSYHSSSNGSSSGSQSTANTLNHHMQGEQQQQQQHYPKFVMRAPILNAPVHSAYLGGKCEYLEMPTSGPASAEITTPAQWNRAHKVFIGHVKFEVSADGLRWVIYMLTGVQAGKIEVRGMGCFMCFFGSAEDVFRVRGLHKRVIFDTQGIWFAQNQDQEQTLHHYAQNVAPSVHAKLPKGLMVVDEETSRRRNRKPKNHTSAQNAERKQQGAIVAAADVNFQQAPPAVTVGSAAFQAENADQLWAAESQFHKQGSASRVQSTEDEYCS